MNAIVGPTDNGKSAIVRAIKWVLYNKPSGTEYIRNGATKCIVIAEFSDGTIITRTRGVTSPNAYDITYPDGRTQHFESFGVNPPEEVLVAHGMIQVNIGSSVVSLNMADQLDGPFMLQESSGTRADMIGAVAHTGILDAAIKDVNSDVRVNKIKTTDLDKDIIKLEESLKAYDGLDAIGQVLSEVKLAMSALELEFDDFTTVFALDSRWQKATQEQAAQEARIKSYQVFDTMADDVSKLADILMNYKAVLSVYNKRENEQGRLNAANITLEKYKDCGTLLVQLDELMQKLAIYGNIRNKTSALSEAKKKVDTNQTVVDTYNGMGEASLLFDNLQTIVRGHGKVFDIQTRLINTELRQRTTSNTIKNIQYAFDESVSGYQDAVAAAGKCPVCFGEIGKDDLERIKQNLV